MSRLSLSLLGTYEITLDGAPVTGFESAKVRALLAYLAVGADRAHSRETLVGLLWSDWPERSARNNLRRALSNLRTAIGDRTAEPPFLSISRETIQFNLAGDHWLDVSAFRALAEMDQEERLEEAVALYRGRFLEGFSVRDSAAYDDWSGLVREQLARQASMVLRRLVELCQGRGDLDRASEHARRWVDLAPWNEEAHRHLMRLLAQRGQRSAALAQYAACRRALARELDVEPSAETIALYERIRDGEIGAARQERGTRHNLPPQLTPFIGRRALLSEIRERLEDPACRLLTLVGPGGSGKTRLALKVASDLASDEAEPHPQGVRFPDSVYFVPMAHLSSADAIDLAIGQALRVPFSPAGAPRD